jgi:hypothetical protein
MAPGQGRALAIAPLTNLEAAYSPLVPLVRAGLSAAPIGADRATIGRAGAGSQNQTGGERRIVADRNGLRFARDLESAGR